MKVHLASPWISLVDGRAQSQSAKGRVTIVLVGSSSIVQFGNTEAYGGLSRCLLSLVPLLRNVSTLLVLR
jgi:hypothetical protein